MKVISWLVWALFGNDLDGVDAQSAQSRDWKPHLTGWRRRVAWWLRNPFHNLLWHVLGVVDRQTQQLGDGWRLHGRYPLHNLPPVGARFNWRVMAKDGRPPLPFFALRLGKVELYLGWRERGNLGAACRPAWPVLVAVAIAAAWWVL